MDKTQEQAAIEIAADAIHEQWQKDHFAQKGEGTPRWKPLKPASVEWIEQKGNVPASAVVGQFEFSGP